MEQYAQSEHLNGDALAARLSVPPELLGRLGVCRRPSGETFCSDVHLIAQRFGADESALAAVVRRADALTALRRGEVDVEFVAAARDRHDSAAFDATAPYDVEHEDEEPTP
jgi:hypothetical protein